MKKNLLELDYQEVIGLNKNVTKIYNIKNNSNQPHVLVKQNELKSCLAGIFARDFIGTYYNIPIEKMAGLLLYRIAQGQFFMDGNKRTAILSMKFFLFNNGINILIKGKELEELTWGFAVKKYNDIDSIQSQRRRRLIQKKNQNYTRIWSNLIGT